MVQYRNVCPKLSLEIQQFLGFFLLFIVHIWNNPKAENLTNQVKFNMMRFHSNVEPFLKNQVGWMTLWSVIKTTCLVLVGLPPLCHIVYCWAQCLTQTLLDSILGLNEGWWYDVPCGRQSTSLRPQLETPVLVKLKTAFHQLQILDRKVYKISTRCRDAGQSLRMITKKTALACITIKTPRMCEICPRSDA